MTEKTYSSDDRSLRVDPDYPIEPVPSHARRNAFAVLLVLGGFVFYMPTLLSAAHLGSAFSFDKFVIVILAGSMILGLFGAALGAIAAHTGLTAPVLARYTFGAKGSKVVSLLMGVVYLGWLGVDIGFFGELLAHAFGWEGATAIGVVTLVSGLVMMSTAYIGFKGMYWLSFVSVVPLLILMVWVVFRSIDEIGGWGGLLAYGPSDQMSISDGITITVGTFVAGAAVVGNWARFARTPGQAFWMTLIAFLLGNGFMVFCGGIGGMSFGQGDFVEILYQLGLVTMGVLLLIGSTWTSVDNDVYATAISGTEIWNSRDKRPFVVASGILGTLIAVSGIYNVIIPFVVILGLTLPPIGVVLFADWVIVWRHGLPHPAKHEFAGVRSGNVIACIVGIAVAVGTKYSALGIPVLNGMAVSLIATWVVSAVGDKSGRLRSMS